MKIVWFLLVFMHCVQLNAAYNRHSSPFKLYNVRRCTYEIQQEFSQVCSQGRNATRQAMKIFDRDYAQYAKDNPKYSILAQIGSDALTSHKVEELALNYVVWSKHGASIDEVVRAASLFANPQNKMLVGTYVGPIIIIFGIALLAAASSNKIFDKGLKSKCRWLLACIGVGCIIVGSTYTYSKYHRA